MRYLRSGKAGFFDTSWTRLSLGLRKHQASWTWDESGGEIIAFTPDVGYAFQIKAGYNMWAAPRQFSGGKIVARNRGGEKPLWLHEVQENAVVTAMLVTENALFIAGPQHRERPMEGGFLRLIDREDGSKINQIDLPVSPVHDGMAAAEGRVFIVLYDGSVLCLGE